MLQNYINQQRLIKAIEARDANFIKNAYYYHRDEYISLCKTIVVNKAFINAQRASADEYSDKSVDFWRVICNINSIHSAKSLQDSGQSTGLIKLNILPKYYTHIIKATGDMNNNVLENFVPIWCTQENLIRFPLIALSSVGAIYGLYEANKYFEFRKHTVHTFDSICQELKYLWADTPKRNALLYLLAAISCSAICFKIITSDATKEAVFNFSDWAKSERKQEHTANYVIEIGRKKHRDGDTVSLSE